MLRLTLTEEIPGGEVKHLGEVVLTQECWEPRKKIAAYSLESEGQRIGTVSGWLQCYGPWRLAQTALNVIYGGMAVPRHKQLAGGGQCNAQTRHGHRCRLDSVKGGYYCVIHDPVR